MAKKANQTPSRTCDDCFHFSACHMWAVSISTDVAPQCPQFEPARYASLADLHEMHQMVKGELVQVVRCRECKYYNRALRLCNNGLGERPFEFYCADGAKKDGGEDNADS